MEYARSEINAVELAIAEITDTPLAELSELQLTLVGGGGGEVVFA